jgi:hypothetical protein
VQAWLDKAAAADAAEDAKHGADRRGEEMPEWMADEHRRLARIRAAYWDTLLGPRKQRLANVVREFELIYFDRSSRRAWGNHPIAYTAEAFFFPVS